MPASERTRVTALAVELTALCNQKCGYCYNGWREDAGKGVGSADGAKLLARLQRLFGAWQVNHVTLTGGEPLLHPQLFEVLELCRSQGVGAQIISNGGLVTPELAQQLAGYSLRFIQVTLNGPDAALHEEHVGPGHFEKTLRGVRLLRDAGVPVVGCVVVTRKKVRGASGKYWLSGAHSASSRSRSVASARPVTRWARSPTCCRDARI